MNPNTILDRIVENKKRELAAELSARIPTDELETFCRNLPPTRSLKAAFRAVPGKYRILAELKRASPSKGMIRPEFDPEALALELKQSGAAALSVLTEKAFFKGELSFLSRVRVAVKIPLLRKDFIIDPYQIYEARLNGADAVLLIAAILDDAALHAFTTLAHDLGLQVLAEAHTADELNRVLSSGADLIGVNARDLATFETSLERAGELIAHIPPGRTAIAESAIQTPGDMAFLTGKGASGFLVGETLMRAESPGAALRKLCERGESYV